VSKAFTKESDIDEPALGTDGPDLRLPAGARNYVTAEGLADLKRELGTLQESNDPTRERLRRLRYLQLRIETAELVAPSSDAVVRFGATVRVRDDEGAEREYRIVGVDEADPARGRISWVAPLARALLGAKAGDVVTWRPPRGRGPQDENEDDEDLEVLAVTA
jgi:transcription elongation factor GreB